VAQEMLITSYLTVGQPCKAQICAWLTDGPLWGSLTETVCTDLQSMKRRCELHMGPYYETEIKYATWVELEQHVLGHPQWISG
jgi:hypothetical protein